VADELAASWERVGLALAPVLGARGVAALYVRSLHLASARHPWLGTLTLGAGNAMDLARLKSAVAAQQAVDAADAGDALLQTFHDLLVSLVGLSLTERLLRPVGLHDSSGNPDQDAAP
jgi:hypothetical protein